MAIQKINLGSEPLGEGGDTYRSANTKINENFSNTAHAASRLVGLGTGNLLEVGAAGLASGGAASSHGWDAANAINRNGIYNSGEGWLWYGAFLHMQLDDVSAFQIGSSVVNDSGDVYFRTKVGSKWNPPIKLYSMKNTTKDSNGFIKAASPVVDLYDDHIELNHDAEKQGGITYKKLGTGNYIVKGSLGFAQEGWYIEMPKDANGNVLVAVVYEQLENNDISVKTYAKRFDEETGDVVANLAKPRDIPVGRCINLRLHEVKEQTEYPTTETEAK